MVETAHSGPVLLHSFIDPSASSDPHTAPPDSFLDVGRLPETFTPVDPFEPAQSPDESPRALFEGTDNNEGPSQQDGGAGQEVVKEAVNGMENLHLVSTSTTEDVAPQPPMLVGTVVVDSYVRIREARRAAGRLEGLAREFQEEFVRKQEGPVEGKGAQDNEGG